MRVLYSFPHRLDGPGGVNRTALHQVRGATELGIDVTLCCASGRQELPGANHVVTTLSLGGLRVPHRTLGVRRSYRYHDWRVSRMLHRLQGISDHGMREAAFEKDRRTKMLCLRTAALAEGFTHRLLMMLGMLGPDALPAGREPERVDAAEIRRLAEEVGRMGVRALPPSPDDLVSAGERVWLEGDVVEPDDDQRPVTIDASPAPTFTPAPRSVDVPPAQRSESTVNAMTSGTGRRQTAWEHATPPGER